MAQTLAEIREQLGASGVADAIRRALAAHETVTAAAAALGTKPASLRRAARRAGVAMEVRVGTPGTGTSERTVRRARNALQEGARENRHGK